ncbi:hypothetical protein J1N35_025858 [Gossypium stocksii]|uniref:Uncharacterized protein n=1 Tax=Gossypium stocksii TaxID=47602 RepID=A0A9D3ZWL1_9ROSI|nr:hypothetical protein J1N35_025858 [Gossypium stocksii]
MLRYQWEDAVRFWNSKKGEDRERVGTTRRQKQKFTHTARSKSFACVADDEDKLKEKRAKYEAIASSDSSVNLDDIDNRIIIEFLGPERVSLKDMQLNANNNNDVPFASEVDDIELLDGDVITEGFPSRQNA